MPLYSRNEASPADGLTMRGATIDSHAAFAEGFEPPLAVV